uniref:ANF_receptor domain-containing protein n=1 Tax=Rhabditophanes sp. KR3021 TaxID=114890 RepID=A0AC35U3R3_9BILA
MPKKWKRSSSVKKDHKCSEEVILPDQWMNMSAMTTIIGYEPNCQYENDQKMARNYNSLDYKKKDSISTYYHETNITLPISYKINVQDTDSKKYESSDKSPCDSCYNTTENDSVVTEEDIQEDVIDAPVTSEDLLGLQAITGKKNYVMVEDFKNWSEIFQHLKKELSILLSLSILLIISNQITPYEYRIGTLYMQDSIQWHNLQHAIDVWNNENAVANEFSLTLVSPTSQYSATIEDKMCDIMQHALSVLIWPTTHDPKQDFMLRSMCHHFQIPCITMDNVDTLYEDTNMLFSMSPSVDMIPHAITGLINSLRWPSFVIIFQSDNDLRQVADLFSKYRKLEHLSSSSKILRLPTEPENYGIFFKYIREKIRETNIVFHSNDISLIHNFLAQASYMNMTESKYSYLFTNPDLCLLDDFFKNMQKIYQCNITGLQMVVSDPPMRSDMAMVMDAVDMIGMAISNVRLTKDYFTHKSIICDAGDIWEDGKILADAIRKGGLEDGHTGKVSFNQNGKRENFMMHGITKRSDKFVKVRLFNTNFIVD